MADLDALYKWFDKNRGTIIKNHDGAFVLLKDNAVIGYFSNEKTALKHAKKPGLSWETSLFKNVYPRMRNVCITTTRR